MGFKLVKHLLSTTQSQRNPHLLTALCIAHVAKTGWYSRSSACSRSAFVGLHVQIQPRSKKCFLNETTGSDSITSNSLRTSRGIFGLRQWKGYIHLPIILHSRPFISFRLTIRPTSHNKDEVGLSIRMMITSKNLKWLADPPDFAREIKNREIFIFE